ncbi:MAG: sugar ABC transporter ATP-binding protein [Armatimonadota bacterium]
MSITASAPYLLEMRGVTKLYPGVRALNGVDLLVSEGEVHALLGENGAGKSTLMKVLAGAHRMDSGEVVLGGERVEIASPIEALNLGISIIYQEFNLVPFMSAAENIFLGREPCHLMPGIVDSGRMHSEAKEILDRVGANFSSRTPVNSLSIAQQQMVEIAKAVSVQSRIIVMDEPTAALTDHEVDSLFALIRQMKSDGMSIIYITHRLGEVFDIADRLTVLRDGELVDSRDVATTSREEIIQLMVGRELKALMPKVSVECGSTALSVRNISRGKAFRDVSFDVRAGEILGIAGLVGAGRTEVARCIFGADLIDTGEIWVDGERADIVSPGDAIARGIALVTEDRKAQGLVLGMSVRENSTLAGLQSVSSCGFIRARDEYALASDKATELAVKTPSVDQLVGNLSGGNQQKVVLAKWLLTHSKIIIFDEPTRGIDVGSKAEIYALMNRLAADGTAIIMISSELPEILGMSDRILVMHEGRMAGELSCEEATQESIMHLATGTGLGESNSYVG